MTPRLNKDQNISFQELEPISENEEIYISILSIGNKKEKSKSPGARWDLDFSWLYQIHSHRCICPQLHLNV